MVTGVSCHKIQLRLSRYVNGELNDLISKSIILAWNTIHRASPRVRGVSFLDIQVLVLTRCRMCSWLIIAQSTTDLELKVCTSYSLMTKCVPSINAMQSPCYNVDVLCNMHNSCHIVHPSWWCNAYQTYVSRFTCHAVSNLVFPNYTK